jgi:NitT/TauT family transport system substrate-binding protein
MPVTRAAMSRRRPIHWLYRRARAAVVAVALAIAVLGSGCASTSVHPVATGSQPTNVIVAGVPAQGATGYYVAQDKGLFAKYGLHVTFKAVASSTLVIPDLKSGAVTFASGQYVPYIAADATGVAELRIIAPGLALGAQVNEIMARVHSPVKSLADLKGKMIAVNALNSEVTDLLYNALAADHIAQNQVRLVPIPFPDMAAALATGKVDAAYMTEPYVTSAGQKFGDVGIYDLNTGSAENFPIAGYAVLSSYARQHPRIVKAFAAAIEQGNRIADSNISELQHAFIIGLHLPPHVADVMATGNYPGDPDPNQIQRVVNLMLRYGQLSKPFNVKTMIGV